MMVLALAYASSSTNFVGFRTVANMPYNASDMVSTLFGDDVNFSDGQGARIYLTGGCVQSQVCNYTNANKTLSCSCPKITDKLIYFSPKTVSYTSTGLATMPRQRTQHMAARLGNYLYVLGGRDANGSVINAVDRYNVLTNEWEANVTTWANATSDGVAFSSSLQPDLVFVVGGYSNIYTSQSAMTALNVTSMTFLTSCPSMPSSRGDIAVTQVGDSDFYVLGGWTSADEFHSPLTTAEVFFASNMTWKTVASMTYGRGDLAAGTLKGWVFSVGGETRPKNDKTYSYSLPVPTVERFVPGSLAWSPEESIPADLFRFVGTSYNDAIYLFGGQGVFNNVSLTYPIKGETLKYIPESTTSSQDKLSAGGIAGIVIGGFVAIVVVILAAGYFCYRRHSYSNLKDEDASDSLQTTAGDEGSMKRKAAVATVEDIELNEAFPTVV
eukprot:gene10553-11693_t